MGLLIIIDLVRVRSLKILPLGARFGGVEGSRKENFLAFKPAFKPGFGAHPSRSFEPCPMGIFPEGAFSKK
jgi:hypothetical protein